MAIEPIRQESEEDEAFLQLVVLPEEYIRQHHPTVRWLGGYRWFVSDNIVRLELYRTEEDMARICAVLLGQPRTEVGKLRSKVGA